MTGRRRRPAPRFLARPRRLPQVVDELVVVERVAAAVSMIDEPEKLGPGVADTFGTHAAFVREQQRLANLVPVLAVRATLTLEQRLAGCEHAAKRRHVNATHELHVLRGEIAKARLGGRQPRPSVLARLERLEATLDAL